MGPTMQDTTKPQTKTTIDLTRRALHMCAQGCLVEWYEDGIQHIFWFNWSDHVNTVIPATDPAVTVGQLLGVLGKLHDAGMAAGHL